MRVAAGKLVVVIPGIGGSILAEARDDRYETVWDAGFVAVAELVLQPSELTPDRSLVPMGPIRSKKLLPGWTVIHGYESLVRSLAGDTGVVDWGHPARPVPNADVVVFAYDWRRSIVDAARQLDSMITARLAGLTEGEKTKRVVVVAHSMGGLVARYWLGPLARWSWCHSLVTLGTPHRGAPKALDTLVNGVRIKKPLLDRVVVQGATDLLRSFPAVYELLPRYPMVLHDGSGTYPKDLPIDKLVPQFTQRAGAAFAVHEDIEDAWNNMPSGGTKVVPVMGWNNATPASATWQNDELLLSEQFPTWLGLPEWEHDAGDGTVPMISAIPIEMGEQGAVWHRALDRHGPLAAAPIAAEITDDTTRPGPSAARHSTQPTPAAGLLIDEWVSAGLPVPVAVDLHQLPSTTATTVVTVRRDKPNSPTILRLDLGPADASGRARGEFPPLPPGRYQVEVSVTDTDVGDLARITDAIDVVE